MRSFVRSAALARAADLPPRYRHQPRKRVRPSGATLIDPLTEPLLIVTPALCATSQADAPARIAPEAPPNVAASQPITATTAQVRRPLGREALVVGRAGATEGVGGGGI